MTSNFKTYIPIITLILVLFINAFSPLNWGYDEFGAIVTHLELDDQDYIDLYEGYLTNVGISNQFIVDFFTNYILPIIVVPLRWTYALGISPVLGLSRIISVDWPLLGSIMLISNIFLTGIGAYLVSKTISKKKQSGNILIIFILLVLLSHPFLKWTLTLTSYSYHLFCFGLLFYSETGINRYSNGIFNKASISRSIVQIFNYQYIVVVAVFGLLEFIKNPLAFFKGRLYLNWIIPTITAIISIVFLIIRADVTGQHDNPAFASVDSSKIHMFDFLSNTDSWIESIKFFINRFVDFIYYFFFESDSLYDTSHYFQLDFFIISPFLVLGVVLYFSIWRKIDFKFRKVLVIFVLSLFVPYLIGIQPMTPSRHSLVLFIPVVLILSFIVNEILKSMVANKYSTWGLLLLLCVGAYQSIGFNQYKQEDLVISEVIPVLEKYNIQHLVLNRCDFRPILYKNIKEGRVIYYQCGSVVARKIADDVDRVAVLSERKISAGKAKEIIANYSNKDWVLSAVGENLNDCNNFECLSSFIVLNAR